MTDAGSRTTSPFALTLLANHHPALHGLRVLAIVSVLQVHVTVMLVQRELVAKRTLHLVSTMVWFGMDLFFLLSGFLIGGMLLHEQRRAGTLRRFYLRRAFRTFPLYYVVLFGLALFLPNPLATTASLAREATYTMNYAPDWRPDTMPWGWSLCVEEHFYLAVPLLVFALRVLKSDRARLGALLTLFLSALVVRWLTWSTAREVWTDERLFTHLYVRTHTRYDVLIAGVALAWVQQRYGAALRTTFASARARSASFAVGLACLAWLMMPPSSRPGIAWTLLSWGTVTSVMYVAWILPLLNHEGPIARALGARPFLWIATLGYGVYLVHVPVCEHLVIPLARVVARSRPPLVLTWPLLVLLLLVLSLCVSYALHLVVEKPALWIRDRVAP